MSKAQAELDAFTLFASQQLADGSDHDLAGLFELWQQEQTDQTSAEDISAAQAAIADFDAGDRGRPAGELTGQLRRSLGS